jgi:hypothetical protein
MISLSEVTPEKSATAFLQRILADRPELKQFHLAIAVRGGGKKDAFNFDYLKDGIEAFSKNEVSPAMGNRSARVAPTTLASKKAEYPATPECKTIINHAVIQMLYERMLELGEYGRRRDFDDFDELDEKLRMSQEWANEDFGYYEGVDEYGFPSQPYWAMP